MDKVDATFECDEIDNCGSSFDKTVLFTFDSSATRFQSSKVDVHVLRFDRYRGSRQLFLLARIFPQLMAELFGSLRRGGIRGAKRSISVILRSGFIAAEIEKTISTYASTPQMFYSYWFNAWATSLAMIKLRYPDVQFVTRAHGTDVFEHRVEYGRIPWRSFQLKRLSSVHPVSNNGTMYLRTKYPFAAARIITSRLGTDFHGLSPVNVGGTFTIVSCATIRDIKRIHLIPKILFHLPFAVRWVHVGGFNANDPSMTQLRSEIEILKKNRPDIVAEVIGNLDPSSVFELYRSTGIDLFLSVSETEGLPVSMMEAISFGIPVLSTDVGGCREIVTADTGKLIAVDCPAPEIANAIASINSAHWRTSARRQIVHEFWKQNFERRVNYADFVSKALSR